MATPKKNVSKSRRNMRRFSGGNRLDPVSVITCPECSEITRAHRVCKCGFYNKTKVLSVKVKAQPQA